MFERIAMTVAALVLAATGVAAQGDDSLRDPTRPAGAAPVRVEATAPRFVVSAIFFAKNRRVAVLNGQPVSVGDSVAGARVRAVTAHDVQLDYRGRTLHVALDLARIRE